ncbi:MAG: peptide deformylase [Planctomycetia bacterium]|nr:peptide deformylase [Planctomycetia bacterium]
MVRTPSSYARPLLRLSGTTTGALPEFAGRPTEPAPPGVVILQIIQYPHPTLRHISKPLKRVDKELHEIVRGMFELMYAAKGVGLAANQVDLPYRLFIINLQSDSAAADQEFVFLNPVLTSRKGNAEAEEGCLSLPGLYGDVKRPERVVLNAYNLAGQELTMELDGLFARAVQHEIDHLDGILFIDRLGPTGEMAVKDTLEEFEIQFAGYRERGEIPDDKAIARRLAELETLRT